MMFHFYNTFLKSFSTSSTFSGRIIISSTSLKFPSETGSSFTILSGIFFPINPPVASAALWTTFLEVVFKASSPVFVSVSNNGFQCDHVVNNITCVVLLGNFDV